MKRVLLVVLFCAIGSSENEANPQETVYVCHARSLTGMHFSARGTHEVETQNEAVRKCEAASFRCYPTGCDEVER